MIAANVRPHKRLAGVPLISDPVTARVTDLFNVGYEILLQIFQRFFAHTEETDAQLNGACFRDLCDRPVPVRAGDCASCRCDSVAGAAPCRPARENLLARPAVCTDGIIPVGR